MKTEDKKHTKASRYAGGNERLDSLLLNFTEDVVWVVDGVNGRKILIGDTEADVIDSYNSHPSRWRKE